MDELNDSDEQGEVDVVQPDAPGAGNDASGGPFVELTHEALLRGRPELRAWVDKARKTLRAQRRLTEVLREWNGTGRNDTRFAFQRLAQATTGRSGVGVGGWCPPSPASTRRSSTCREIRFLGTSWLIR